MSKLRLRRDEGQSSGGRASSAHSRLAPATSDGDDEQLRRRVVEGKDRELKFLPAVLLAAQYVHVNAVREKRRTAIGITTVLIVVMFIGVLYNVMLRSPLIFLRIAETQVGEIDMLITPYVPHFDPLLNLDSQTPGTDPTTTFRYFNATEMDLSLSSLSTVTGATPRWLLRGKASAREAPANALPATILICDLAREDALNIGRGWPHRLLGEDEAHVSSALLAALGLRANAGQRLRVDIGFGKLLTTFGLDADFLEELLLASIRTDNGVKIQLSGAQITAALALRGIQVEAGLLPETIETQVPRHDCLHPCIAIRGSRVQGLGSRV